MIMGIHFAPDGRNAVCLRSLGKGSSVGCSDRSGISQRAARRKGLDSIRQCRQRGDRLAIGLSGADRKDEVYLLAWPTAACCRSCRWVNGRWPLSNSRRVGICSFIATPGELSLHDSHTLQKLRQVHCQAGESVLDIDFLPDGKRMLTADNVPGASIRDVRTGKVLARLAGHQGSVRMSPRAPTAELPQPSATTM